MADESLLKKYQVPLICTILALLVIAAFEPLRHNDFVDYDDKTYILLNYHIHSGFTYDSLKWAFTSGRASNWHPLTWLSHMADIELFGLNPVGHHLHNLGLHIAATLLLFLILRSMTGKLWPSAFVAAAFGLHPLRVESVAWAAERKDVLCAFFWMLTTAAYTGYARRGGFLRYLLVVLSLCLGLMAKPMIVTLPVVFLLLDIWPLKRVRIDCPPDNTPETAGTFRRASIPWLIMEKIPLLIPVAVSCLVTYKIQYWSGAVDSLDVTAFQQVTNALVSYTGYLQKTVWPVHLAPLYPFPENGWPIWKPALALALLSGWSAFAVYAARKRPWLLIGWLWYIITLVPVIGLVQIGSHAMADRYSYLPSIGILIITVWAAEEFCAKWKHQKKTCAVLGGVLILAMIITTRIQVTYWKNPFVLNKRVLAVTENNYTICNNISVVLMEEKKYEEALYYLQKALELRPHYYLANTNMANLMKEMGQYDKALTYVSRAIKDMPHDGLAYFIQGRILADMGKSDAALAAYKTAAKLNPDDFRFFYDTGLLLAKKGKFEQAVHYFKECIRCNPNWPDVYRDMGLALQNLGYIEDALFAYRKATELNPGDYVIYYRIGYCFQELNHPRDASYFYRQAIKIKPDFLQALDRLAWILATHPDSSIRNPTEAVRLAEKACELTELNDYRVLNTLAAAYAGRQQFMEASEVMLRAITLARTNNDTEAVEEFTPRLELYQKGQPYLEPAPAESQSQESIPKR